MAATPPMPPGANNFQLNGNQQQQQQQQPENNTNSNSSNNTTPTIVEALQQHFQFKALLNADEQEQEAIANNSNSNNISRSSSGSNSNSISSSSNSNNEPTTKSSKLNNCSCTNISIMHLFHEMKQEFPTLPDALVTQCVNENCHQRDNCIQMLRKELSLHPSPVQSYPAKVVQQQQHLQQRPLKPLRAAPTTPPATTTPPTPSPARPRPTTLNLQRQLNAQLQQKIQQRQQQQQQQQQRQPLTPGAQQKPLRRAPPLPPLPPPKPTPTTTTTTASNCSNDSSCLTSPLSSSESELSLNVSLSSPTLPAAQSPAAAATIAQQQLRSPVRHRSVINLQPEPPYARDFLTHNNNANAIAISPAISPTSSSSGQSTPGGNQRKSFTSLNLTLRQPQSVTSNGGAAPSTIDITAGPAPSGNGCSGITYSSSSFDARRGTHKNFQLTVTDEGSVFSAGCVRPQTPLYAPCAVLATDGATPPPAAATPTTIAAAATAQQQQQQLWEQATAAAAAQAQAAANASEMMSSTEVFPYATLAQKYVVASNYNNNHLHNNNNNNSSDNSPSVTHMPLYEGIVPESDREAHAAKIERQKTRRDKLANALRDNKKRLLSLEQEINILTEPVPAGESERLDRDIKKLTDDCQRLLNMINDPQLNGTATAANTNSMNRQLSAPSGAQQQQPFQRQQRPARQVAPPNSLRLHSVPSGATQPQLDFVQHQSSVSAPSSGCLTPQQQQQLEMQPPPTYAQYYQFQQFLQNQRAAAAAAAAAATSSTSPPLAAGGAGLATQHTEEDDESLSESEVDESEEPLDMWACNLCTFRNHPQLNICEACDNVRIPLGMIRIVPSAAQADNAAAASAATPSATTAVESDANRQQPYALHT